MLSREKVTLSIDSSLMPSGRDKESEFEKNFFLPSESTRVIRGALYIESDVYNKIS